MFSMVCAQPDFSQTKQPFHQQTKMYKSDVADYEECLYEQEKWRTWKYVRNINAAVEAAVAVWCLVELLK